MTVDFFIEETFLRLKLDSIFVRIESPFFVLKAPLSGVTKPIITSSPSSNLGEKTSKEKAQQMEKRKRGEITRGILSSSFFILLLLDLLHWSLVSRPCCKVQSWEIGDEEREKTRTGPFHWPEALRVLKKKSFTPFFLTYCKESVCSSSSTFQHHFRHFKVVPTTIATTSIPWPDGYRLVQKSVGSQVSPSRLFLPI